MALVRGWARGCRGVQTVAKRVARRPVAQQLIRSSLRAYCQDETSIAAYPEKLAHREPLDQVQVQQFIQDLVEKAENGEDIACLLSKDTTFSDAFSSICENAGFYEADTIVDLLEHSHRSGVTNEHRLMPLAEELASRIEYMSFQHQQRALHVLWKLNLDSLRMRHDGLDMVAFASALRQNTVNNNAVSYTVYSLRNKSWSSELTESLQEYVVANAAKLNLRSVYQILSVMIEKRIATKEVVGSCAKSVAHTLSLDVPNVTDRLDVWGANYPSSLANLLWAFGRVLFYDEELYATFASLIQGEADPLLHTPRFISNLAWSCAKVRFYSESLMDSIADLSLRTLAKFKNQDLALLLYSFAFFNCMHLDLFNAAVDKVVGDPDHLDNTKLCWTVAWASMVLEQYPEKLLSEILTDDYLKCKLNACSYVCVCIWYNMHTSFHTLNFHYVLNCHYSIVN